MDPQIEAGVVQYGSLQSRAGVAAPPSRALITNQPREALNLRTTRGYSNNRRMPRGYIPTTRRTPRGQLG
eukprot:3846308-Pyramimonas_sp.AAC.1